MLDLLITDHPLGVRLRIRVKPRASKSKILGPANGELQVALAAPPVDGEANTELLRSLAAQLALPKTSISITSGQRSRTKVLQFAGIDANQLRLRLEPHFRATMPK